MILKSFITISRLFAKCKRGVAYVEFAIAAPILLMMFLGSVELSRYLLIIQKLEKTVSTVTDVVTQASPQTNPLTSAQLQQIASAVTDMMFPYTSGASDTNIIVILTDVVAVPSNPTTNPPTPTVKWQYCGGGGATLASMAVFSKVTPTKTGATAIGTTANLSGATSPFGLTGFAMTNNEEVLIGEVYYRYSPIINNPILSVTTIYKPAVYMPRLGALSGFNFTCP